MKRWAMVLAVLLGLSWLPAAPAGDYDGDGTDDIGIFRGSNGLWAVRGVTRVYFGGASDDPLPGDYAGKGMAEIAVFRESSGLWAVRGRTRIYFGGSGDEPLPGSGGCSPWRRDLDWPDMDLYYAEGDVRIGTSSTAPYGAGLYVVTNKPTGYAAELFNDGNSTLRRGIGVQCGTDNGSGNNYLAVWYDGDRDWIGDVSFTGSVVSYNPFTASHQASVPEEMDEKGYPYGTVMCLRFTHPGPDRPHQAEYEVEPCRKAYDKSVFGVYSGKHEKEGNLHLIYALGDGQILISKEGGDIEIGDYLTTSSQEGHAMKQGDDLLHNYTVAKALETVDWDKEESDTKLISCSYHAQ